MTSRPPHVAVVGGGITGLAAAYRLATGDPPVRVTLHEASDRLGGKLHTTRFRGLPVETGPDAALARVPWAVGLLDDLGLAGEAVHPATGKAWVWTRGRLRPLPEGLVLGVPGRLLPVARSGVLSPAGLARAGLDLVLPASPGGDRSIAEVIGRRFGREVVDRLVEPLLSGINAGTADNLSLASTAPDVATVAAANRSLLLGLRRRPAASPGAGPVFVSVDGGMSRLVERLEEALREAGVEICTRSPVASLAGLGADASVVTVPGPAAAGLLPEPAASEARAIEYASVGVVTLAYPAGALPSLPPGSGLLVPRVEGWMLTAATFMSQKWPARTPPGEVLIRCSTGRYGDDRFASLDDEELVRRLHGELARAVEVRGEPLEWRVDRWMDSFPQYAPGHAARVERVEQALPPDIVVAGAAWKGVGIASCIRQADEAAALVRTRLSRLL